MRNIYRTLSVLLCLALLGTAIPVDPVVGAFAYAESIELEPAPEVVAEPEAEPAPAVEEPVQELVSEPTEEPAAESTAEPAEEASAEPTSAPAEESAEDPAADVTPDPTVNPDALPTEEPVAEVTAEPTAAPAEVPSEEPTAEPTPEAEVIDYTRSALENPSFAVGFAELLSGDTIVYDGGDDSAEEQAKLAKGVVYALDRVSGEMDRLQIAYNPGMAEDQNIETGWVDASALRPMDPIAEIPGYVAGCTGDEFVRLVKDDENLPLRAIACTYPEPEIAPSEEPTEEPTAEPTAEPTIEPTEEPVAESTEEPAAETTPEPIEMENQLDGTDSASAKSVAVSLNKTSLTIGVGDATQKLQVLFSDGQTAEADGTVRPVVFKSSNTRYVTVDAITGQLKGVRKGNATVTAVTPYGDVTCAVSVKSAPRSISISPKTGELAIGESGQLKPSFGSSSYGGSVRYVSSDTNILTVDENGLVTGVSKGTATVSAYAFNLPSKPAVSTINVLGPATQIDVSDSSITFAVGMERQLSVAFQPNERDTVTYTTDNANVASVTKDGMVRGTGKGTAVITATTPGGVTDTCTVTVLPAPEEKDIVLLAGTYKIGLNEKFNLHDLLSVQGDCYAEFTFQTSSTRSAPVAEDGVLTGKRASTVTVTATTQNGIERKCKLTICKNPKSVSFAEKNIQLGVGMSASTSVIFNKSGTYSQHIFLSSDESIAKVDAKTGVITAVSAGTATITCKPMKGSAGTCTVNVLSAPETISANPAVVNVGMGETGRRVVGNYPNGTMCHFTYKSLNENIVKVNAFTGEITTVAEGIAEVEITSNNGKTARATVNVLKAPTFLKLSQTSLKLMVGEEYSDLSYTVDEGAASGISFKSSNSKYVKVENGRLVGVRKGNATVTVSTYNGETATCKVQVLSAPKSVSFVTKTYNIGVGMEAKPEVKFSSTSYYSPVTYSSSDEAIVTVNPETGAIKAVGKGTATVTARTLNNKTAACTVNVLSAPETISANPAVVNVGMGETGRKLAGSYPDGTMCTFSYKSLNEAIVKVDSVSGEITTVAEGIAEVEITSNNGKTARATVNVLKAPTFLKLSQTSLKLMVGEEYSDLSYTVDEGAASGISFKSSNSKYVKVENGRLVGVRKGNATITVSTYNGETATCKVQVLSAPKSVSFVIKTYNIGVGMEAKPEVKFPSTSYYSPVTYSSSDEAIVTVNPETGAIKAVGKGTATVTARTLNNKTAACTVNVLSAPETIGANPAVVNVGMGETGRKIAGSYPDGTMCTFSYKSLNEAIVKVDSVSGEITTVAEGIAEVEIISNNGKTAKATVNVLKAPTFLKLSQTSLKLMVGEEYGDLSYTVDEGAASGISFKSSNSKYVKVENGRLVGVRKGNATITVSTYNGETATCKVQVLSAPKSISFANKSYNIGVGMEGQPPVKFPSSSYYSPITYSSGNEDVIIIVPETGMVKGVGVGTATLTARTLNNKTATCSITVSPAPSSVRLEAALYEIAAGMSKSLKPILNSGSVGTCSYKSSDDNIVSVDADGKMTGHAAGTATITVITHNGKTTTCEVKVTPAPYRLKYDFAQITMLKGSQLQLPEPVAYDVNGNICPSTYTFTSSKSRYLSVDANGVAKGTRNGTYTITAESYNGITASFKVTVASSVTGFAITPEEAVLAADGAGYAESVQLVPSVAAAAPTMKYSTSNPSVAVVDANGKVTAVGPGEARITAMAINGTYAVSTIRVQKVTGKVSLEEEAITLAENMGYQLKPVIDAGMVAAFSYASSNADVASVNEDGYISAKKAGSAKVTVSTQNGKTASVNVEVLPAPDSVAVNPKGVSLVPGQTIKVTAETRSTAEKHYSKVAFSSENPEVAKVAEDGTVNAVAEGETRIVATTCNGLTAGAVIRVASSEAETQVSFGSSAYSIISGDSAELPVVLNKAAIEKGYALVSSHPELVSVNGMTINAASGATGQAILTLTVNTAEGEAPIQASCTIDVVAGATITLPEEEITLLPMSAVSIMYELNPANLIGTFECSPADKSLIRFNPETGEIASYEKSGSTQILFKTFNDQFSCPVTVLEAPDYRALVISSYNSNGLNTDLPFAANNVSTVRNTLSRATILGEKYSVTSADNPSKAGIRDLIRNTFADAKENDVSLIYITTHGHNQNTGTGYSGYYFSLAPNYSVNDPGTYVTAPELMNWISGINGNVVLVLDSCYSGAFIQNCSAELAEHGNISVLTAQDASKSASYYVGKTSATHAEFLTFALCYGLGVEMTNTSIGSLPADGNGDRQVSVSEAFSYARSQAKNLISDYRGTYSASSKYGIKVPGVNTQAKFDAWYQEPQIYLAPGANELVLFTK